MSLRTTSIIVSLIVLIPLLIIVNLNGAPREGRGFTHLPMMGPDVVHEGGLK